MIDRPAAYDEQLPWLQPVEDEDAPSGISARKMLALIASVLVGAALVASTFFLMGRRDAPATAGEPELIRAEPGPYKVKPTDPGGLDVTGESETAYQTSAGEDNDSRLATAPGAEPKPAPAAEPVASPEVPAKPPEPELKPQPTGAPGTVIQLGAFKNNAQAERAWAALSARFPSVAGLNKMLVPFSGGVRLRAAAPSTEEASAACRAVQAGGENCFVAR